MYYRVVLLNMFRSKKTSVVKIPINQTQSFQTTNSLKINSIKNNIQNWDCIIYIILSTRYYFMVPAQSEPNQKFETFQAEMFAQTVLMQIQSFLQSKPKLEFWKKSDCTRADCINRLLLYAGCCNFREKCIVNFPPQFRTTKSFPTDKLCSRINHRGMILHRSNMKLDLVEDECEKLYANTRKSEHTWESGRTQKHSVVVLVRTCISRYVHMLSRR